MSQEQDNNTEDSLIDRLHNSDFGKLKTELETVVAKKIANKIADHKAKYKEELLNPGA